MTNQSESCKDDLIDVHFINFIIKFGIYSLVAVIINPKIYRVFCLICYWLRVVP